MSQPRDVKQSLCPKASNQLRQGRLLSVITAASLKRLLGIVSVLHERHDSVDKLACGFRVYRSEHNVRIS